jgi:hypothetical protein
MARSIWKNGNRITALVCAFLLLHVDMLAATQGQASSPAGAAPQSSTPISGDQLDSLVAPIALYPDPLLAQVLAASTYPLEIVQLQQWLSKHKNLKDKALADAVQKENWDPSVQALAALPDVVKQLADNIKWTAELGNAFLAQQSEVMNAVQRMRKKAKDGGKLKSNEQLKIETKVVESKNVIVIEQANPQVVYVPSYDPVVVYGPAPVYAYPPVYYPPAGYYAAGMALSFGVGVMMGAFWSGGWGYNCGWGGNNTININNNNNFNRNANANINRNTRANVGSGNRATQWQHNPQHRGGAPYGDRATANKFGGTARGDSLSTRQANARQNQSGRGDRNVGANRGDMNDRNLGTNRGDANDRNLGANRGDASDRNLGANRGGANDRNLGANRGAGTDGGFDGDRGGGDRIGNREISSGAGRDGGAFGGAGRTSGASARSSSARGSSSFGGSRGGGGRGGGRRR